MTAAVIPFNPPPADARERPALHALHLSVLNEANRLSHEARALRAQAEAISARMEAEAPLRRAGGGNG